MATYEEKVAEVVGMTRPQLVGAAMSHGIPHEDVSDAALMAAVIGKMKGGGLNVSLPKDRINVILNGVVFGMLVLGGLTGGWLAGFSKIVAILLLVGDAINIFRSRRALFASGHAKLAAYQGLSFGLDVTAVGWLLMLFAFGYDGGAILLPLAATGLAVWIDMRSERLKSPVAIGVEETETEAEAEAEAAD
jgi:hypothetical protein